VPTKLRKLTFNTRVTSAISIERYPRAGENKYTKSGYINQYNRGFYATSFIDTTNLELFLCDTFSWNTRLNITYNIYYYVTHLRKV
jgi:hypothetical protein